MSRAMALLRAESEHHPGIAFADETVLGRASAMATERNFVAAGC